MAAIKDAKIKVETQINGDKLRISGKKRDDLQAVMALLQGRRVRAPAAVRQLPRLSARQAAPSQAIAGRSP